MTDSETLRKIADDLERCCDPTERVPELRAIADRLEKRESAVRKVCEEMRRDAAGLRDDNAHMKPDPDFPEIAGIFGDMRRGVAGGLEAYAAALERAMEGSPAGTPGTKPADTSTREG